MSVDPSDVQSNWVTLCKVNLVFVVRLGFKKSVDYVFVFIASSLATFVIIITVCQELL